MLISTNLGWASSRVSTNENICGGPKGAFTPDVNEAKKIALSSHSWTLEYFEFTRFIHA